MIQLKIKWTGQFLALVFFILYQNSFAQIPVKQREFAVHERGMLHETVYNTGEIGQSMDYEIDYKVTLPYMEWPSNSRTVIDAFEFDGQHNSWGGGVFITANFKGSTGILQEEGRLGAFCGGVGNKAPEPAFGVWSFPISIEKIENFPLLEDGSLNPGFNPNEAEEIIIARWNTSAGISVTRTSRAYSYPDFDDFIIYEYTFENNGIYYDNELNQLVQVDTTLVDVLITFTYGISPSMLGSQRYETNHQWKVHYKLNYPASYWDPDYWLMYNQVSSIGGDTLIGGRPEPFLENFRYFAETGINGGGLLSPQAAGWNVLYYDTDNLSIIDPVNPDRNQSPQFVELNLFQAKDSTGAPIDLNPDGKIRQPYKSYVGNHTNPSTEAWEKTANFEERNGAFFKGDDDFLPQIWKGRFIPLSDGEEAWSTRTLSFGPYYLEPGDKIEFTTAEMVGFGADPEKLVVGGVLDKNKPWNKGWFWNRPVSVEDQIVTENYVADYGIPDYVNSDVIYVNDVAHKAFEAYLGHEISKPGEWPENEPATWPENNPRDGSYRVPIPIPAPIFETLNTDTGVVVIKWKRYVEEFEQKYPDYVSGHLRKFHVYRADYKMGPWKLLGTVELGNVNNDGIYEFIDRDKTFYVEESKYYAVTSVDEHGNESGKTNITLHKKAIGPVPKMTKVYVVPNPFVIESGFKGLGAERMLGIYGLPAKCTIYFYSFAGQRLFTIKHEAQEFSDNWEQITRNNQDLATGVYFFVVVTPEGEKYTGKFMVIK